MVKNEHSLQPFVELPLGARPKVVNSGLAEHGLHGVETYELPRLWCLHLYFYEVTLEVAGHPFSIMPGAVTLIPPGSRIVFKYTGHRSRHFFVHFAITSKAPKVTIPLFQHLPQARDEMLDRLQNMQRVLTLSELHAEILFWGLLWDIAESGLHQLQDEHSLILSVEQFIESSLPGKLTASDVAAHAGVSRTHVNRVVKAAHGLTTLQFIRKCRLQRAYRLLAHSTMPIKLVARECGIEDLQRFNKLMRSEYGTNPRKLRAVRGLKSSGETWGVDRE